MTEHIEDDEESFSDVFQQDTDRNIILSRYLSQLKFKPKVIEFANDFIYKYDDKKNKDN